MEQEVRERLREALLTVTALKTSMEHALRSDPKAFWPHWAYRDYMRKYNDVVAYVRSLVPITAPTDVYDLNKVPHPGEADGGRAGQQPGGRQLGTVVGTDRTPAAHPKTRPVYTWCALDAVGIPAALEEDASIASHCYHCGASVNVEMIAGQVTHAEPANMQIWIADEQVGRSIVSFT